VRVQEERVDFGVIEAIRRMALWEEEVCFEVHQKHLVLNPKPYPSFAQWCAVV
jgi:hypothetical protein